MDNATRFSHIPGWGSDLPRENRPAVPMERTPPRLEVPWSEPPPQQPLTVEILRSVERPDYSRTFGTRVPPKGLSGALRRSAFRYSENDLRHWFTLVAADRVNVVEGLCEDAKRSPRKAAAVGAGIVALVWWLARD